MWTLNESFSDGLKTCETRTVQMEDEQTKQKMQPSKQKWWSGQNSPTAVQPNSSNTRGFPGSLVVQMVKNLPAVWETWVRSLDQEDPLEKGTATYSSILAWRIPVREEPCGLPSMGLQRVGHD